MVDENDAVSCAKAVLIIHPGALGDVLLSRSAIRTIHLKFPQHELIFLADRSVGSFLLECGEINRFVPIDSSCLTELCAGEEHIHPLFRSWLSRCEYVVGWLRDPDGAVAATVQSLGIHNVMVMSPFSPGLRARHQAERYLETIDGLGCAASSFQPLMLPQRLSAEGPRYLEHVARNDSRPLAIIHPGSGSAHKCMEPWRLAKLVEWMRGQGLLPMLLEGPSDLGSVTQLRSLLQRPVAVMRNLDLCTVAAVLSHATLFVGHDSGITHLAAALSVPTLACFGPTDSRRWAPLGPNVTTLTGEPCTCPIWDAVQCCRERKCLHIAPDRMIDGCRMALATRSSAPIL